MIDHALLDNLYLKMSLTRIDQARADLDTAAEQYGQSLVTPTADLARTYIEYRNLQNHLPITRTNLAALRHTLELTEILFKEGGGTSLMPSQPQLPKGKS